MLEDFINVYLKSRLTGRLIKSASVFVIIDDRKLLFSLESQFSKNKENCKFFYFICYIEQLKERESVKDGTKLW